jgi:hypothetical protein
VGTTGSLEFGSLAIAQSTNYLRLPDGSFAFVGEGSQATDPVVDTQMIASGGAHLIFWTGGASWYPPVQLEPEAPPNGTAALYDRTPDGTLDVISLLPSDVTPAAGEEAIFDGASRDGSVIATSDLLSGEDGDETPSVYDARVNGGFAGPEGRSECQGEACQPEAQSPARPSSPCRRA